MLFIRLINLFLENGFSLIELMKPSTKEEEAKALIRSFILRHNRINSIQYFRIYLLNI